jgi:hypothetical protein
VAKQFDGGGHVNASGATLGLSGLAFWTYVLRRGHVARVDVVAEAAVRALQARGSTESAGAAAKPASKQPGGKKSLGKKPAGKTSAGKKRASPSQAAAKAKAPARAAGPTQQRSGGRGK